MWQCRKPRSGVKQWRKEERERCDVKENEKRRGENLTK